MSLLSHDAIGSDKPGRKYPAVSRQSIVSVWIITIGVHLLAEQVCVLSVSTAKEEQIGYPRAVIMSLTHRERLRARRRVRLRERS